MERYKNLRAQLNELGYRQPFKPDCVALVEKIVADLIQTTSNLRKYMTIAKDAINERDNLLLGAEPYKCDNTKLVKECNELHLAFLQFREQNEILQKDLKNRIANLEQEKINCNFEYDKSLKHIRDLELELLKRNSKQGHQNAKLGIRSSLKTNSAMAFEGKTCKEKDKCQTIGLAEQKIKNLMTEVTRLKDERLQLTETNSSLKNQIAGRDKEIERLGKLLEGGRPIQALNQDCCYKDIDAKISMLQNDIKLLQRNNRDLEERLKEAISKQHEAMKRALNLAERNKILEKEMRDIDQIALAVEAECNSTVRNNAEKVSRLQDRINETVLEIQRLERENAELRRDKNELMSTLDVIKTEKRHLQIVLETALDEKKRLTDRINHFTIIENDLNLEIDRLVRASAAQKQKIAELEFRVMSGGQFDSSMEGAMHKQTGKKNKKAGKSTTRKPFTPVINKPKGKKGKRTSLSPRFREDLYDAYPPVNTPVSQPDTTQHINERFDPSSDIVTSTNKNAICHEPDSCVKQLKAIIEQELHNKDVCLNHLKELIGKEIDHLQSQADLSLEHLRNERDYYMKECHVMMEKLKNVYNKPDSFTDLTQKLNEKEQLVMTLQHENKSLAQEKHNLMIRLETARDRVDDNFDSLSIRSVTKRLERERDLLKADILRLEEERDGLRQRLNSMAESHMSERSRLEAILRESEEEIRKLEKERRDYTQTQGSSRATINNLQEECDMLKNQLRTCQTDLNQQRSIYNQLKALHEQTDRALGDSQSQSMQLEKELSMAQDKIKSFESYSGSSNKEILNLKNDLAIMKEHLAVIDQEKDALVLNLDDKTEKIHALEQELNTRDKTAASLESVIADLKKKITATMDDGNSRDQRLKNATFELNRLQQELESTTRAKELAYQENRRLQDDLAACTADCNKTHNELDISRRQVDDLKRQLQHYVAEVKRTEDLISHKEIERSEMLDHFRSLSQEANVLETNNHSLETETSQTKIQLSLALDHVADLERKLETQDTMIRSYEKQIAELTSQIARMEVQVSQSIATQEHCTAELGTMRELCVKLDKQKDVLMKQLNEKDSAKMQIDRDVDKFRRDNERMQNALMKDQSAVENLEKLLAESRQETVEQSLLNGELCVEVQRLKTRLEELQNKLVSTSEQLDLFQEKALDYSQQNKTLRREIANERFHRAKEEEGKRFPSLPLENTNMYVSNSSSNVGNDGSSRRQWSSRRLGSDEHGSLQSRNEKLNYSAMNRNGELPLPSSIGKFVSPPSSSQTSGDVNNGHHKNESSTRKSYNKIEPIVVPNVDFNRSNTAMYTRPVTVPNGSQHITLNKNAPVFTTIPKSFVNQWPNDSVGTGSFGNDSNIRKSPSDKTCDLQFRQYINDPVNMNKKDMSVSMYKISKSFEKAQDADNTSTLNYVSDVNKMQSLPGVEFRPSRSKSHQKDERTGEYDDKLGMYAIAPVHVRSFDAHSDRNYEFFNNRDEALDNPMDDDLFRDKFLRNSSCACLRVCACHDKSLKIDNRSAAQFVPGDHGPQMFSCVFTSAGPTANRYTGTYTFAYNDVSTTSAVKNYMSSTETDR